MPEQAISTYAIERFNLTLRMLNKRFTRKTNAFSKTLRNHERALALTIMYYNYFWLPQPKTKVCDKTGEVFTDLRPDFPPAIGRIRRLVCGLMRPWFPVLFSLRIPAA